MFLARHSLMDAGCRLLRVATGLRRHRPGSGLLAEQTKTAYTQTADHAQLATAKNDSVLAV
ncbi:hypothetical protein [Streptomyces violascens]|uniref:hypothetical protein n=1 Tax=Streptomyces violascens TaxID=67381 RepID=UPI00167A395F|nr:hypothetical protein [Streptomyces violascens]GGU30184.1 hypothetical protein GCM10010289_59510 [Streptomyces violascens]